MLRTRPLLAAVSAVALLPVAGCDVLSSPSAADRSPAPSEARGLTAGGPGEITIEATGEGTAMINYTFGRATGSLRGVRLPWTMSGRRHGSPKGAYLAFVSADAGTGTVGCRILVDGEVSKTGHGEGRYASADCTLYEFELS